ncbi:acyl carrier protein [Actinoplanes sp. NBRC 14428]|uniref:Acyl carrier protein n=1 Tax=Pseudosporangium ferrugineum TaxID=439699 RepID=A0A2T0SAQ4_9ACTN|nr:phosphopantetheine-binding protein [Pseudosporangium ferrugineum]PRY30500.1 acyl carrier protein [Pseudosporangium ferrugineum]BCJ50036.1 acyl carrier protein [Actinoplanes sp. NBRC 14428]
MAQVVDREVVTRLVADTLVQFGVERSEITAQAKFDELDIDSIDVVELRQAIKNEFGVDIRAADFDKVDTVHDAVALVCRQAGAV